MKLRDYQQDAVNAAIAHMKKSTERKFIVTGAGKSLIVAAIAQWVHEFGKKKGIVFTAKQRADWANIKESRQHIGSWGN